MMRVAYVLSNSLRNSAARLLLTGFVISIASHLCVAQTTPAAPSGRFEALFPLCRTVKMCGYIDETGKVVVSQTYAYAARFSEGRGRVQSASGKFSFVGASGKVVIAPKFDDAADFHEGLARVTIKGKSGFIDYNGAWVIPPSITEGPRALPAGVDDFSDGMAFISELNGRQGWIDRTGRFVLNVPTEDSTNWISASGGFGDGLVVFMVSPKQGTAASLYGYMNKSGEKVIRAQFANAAAFGHGLAGVQSGSSQGGKWGYIDPTGRVVIGFRFTYVEGFSDGLAVVGVSDKCGYIDKSGTFVIQPVYDSCGDYSEGLAYVRRGTESGFISRDGKMLPTPRFRAVSSFSSGLAVVQLDAGYAYIAEDGKVIARSRAEIPPF